MKIQKTITLISLAYILTLKCLGDWYSDIESALKADPENYSVTLSATEGLDFLTIEDPAKIQNFTTKLCEVFNQHPNTKITIMLGNINFQTKEILLLFLNGLAQINNLYCLQAWIYVGKEAIAQREPTIFRYLNPR
ncbi:MAG: hypothetical protein ACSW8C_03760 [bacterium]